MRRICWLLIVLWAMAPNADAKEKVRWVLNEGFLPGHISEGPLAGTGFMDLSLRWLIARLGMFDNEMVEATNSRGFRELTQHDGQCMVGVAETPEREAVAVFSHVALVVPPAGVMIRAKSQDRFSVFLNASGDLELSRLEAAAGLQGVYARDRHFGAALDHFIEVHGSSMLSVQNSMQSLKMLDTKRADYVLGYSFERRYYKQALNPASDLVFLPLAGRGRVFPAHVACSRGITGEQVIREVDRLLDEAPSPPPYMAEVSRWFDEADARAAMDPANWGDKPRQ